MRKASTAASPLQAVGFAEAVLHLLVEGEGLAVVLLGVGVLFEEGFHGGQPPQAVGFAEAVLHLLVEGEGLAVVLLGVGVLTEEGFHGGQPQEAVGFAEAVLHLLVEGEGLAVVLLGVGVAILHRRQAGFRQPRPRAEPGVEAAVAAVLAQRGVEGLPAQVVVVQLEIPGQVVKRLVSFAWFADRPVIEAFDRGRPIVRGPIEEGRGFGAQCSITVRLLAPEMPEDGLPRQLMHVPALGGVAFDEG
ncbi:hypothetical protein, partial [Candidatus Amarolinea dominans]|uniref:hypothetical protein n=1 Tax=Candidatus Amarolinea dominans TaxID=3140696 RepID=UPI0031CC3E07